VRSEKALSEKLQAFNNLQARILEASEALPM
jgi:hypothetical protein